MYSNDRSTCLSLSMRERDTEWEDSSKGLGQGRQFITRHHIARYTVRQETAHKRV